MRTKVAIILCVAVIALSTAFSFTNKSTPESKEEDKVASKNSGGFVLEDDDQWK